MSTQSYPYGKIIEKYPHLYEYMKFIECNSGWFDLINELSNKLEKLIIKFKLEDNDSPEALYPRASQVKEKFGKLHFYMTTETDEMAEVIEEAEKKSTEICECCGKEGVILQASWLTCLCENCRSMK